MDRPESTLSDVTAIVASTLGIQDRAHTLTANTALLGSLPELDPSLAIIEIADGLEAHFGFEIDQSDFTADVFETLGSLAAFVQRSLEP